MKSLLKRFVRLMPWFLAFSAAAVIWWWSHSGISAAAPLTFRTAAVQRGDVTQTVTGSGSLSALTTVEVGSQISGNIQRRFVDFNDPVKKGQLLAEIDPSTFEARLFQAEANLQSTQAALNLKKLNIRRSKELLAQALVAQSDYDQLVAELQQLEAAGKNAEAAVKNAKLDLDRCKIYSPVDGVVLRRAADVGQTVQSSYNVATLFVIARDLSQMEIEAAISEADIGSVEIGQPVTFTVDAFPGRSFKGTVRQVRNNSIVSNNVVTYPTIISADNADLKLRPGMTANVVITTDRRINVLRLPNAAVRFKPPDSATIVNAADPGDHRPSFDQAPPEIRRRLIAEFDKNGDGSLDSDERKTMETTVRNRMAAAEKTGGFGPPDGGPGGPPPVFSGGSAGGGLRANTAASAETNNSQPVTVYLVDSTPNATGQIKGTLRAVRVFVGASDGAFTEILSGLKEGDMVASGTVSTQAAKATAAPAASGTNNIFGPPRPPGAKTR